MEFTIRSANVDDAHGIAQVQAASWKTTYAGIVPDAYLQSLNAELRCERWKELLAAPTSESFVAENEAGVFGFVVGGPLREPIAEYDAELYAMYLFREFQRQGVGRRLVAELAAALHNREFRRMVAWVLEKNPAVGFYQRIGGVLIAQKEIEIGGASLQELAFGIGIDDLLRAPIA